MGTNGTSAAVMFGPQETGYQHLLHRRKRDLTWEDIEDFYDDKNNFAMYLVLPLIVIVYGGCAVIYCIARCRRYMRRKKKRAAKKKRQEFMENEPLDPDNENTHNPIAAISSNRNGGFLIRDGASSSSDVLVGMDRESAGDETPLPWQVNVPNEKQLYSNAMANEVVPVAAKGTMKAQRQPLPTNTYTNKGFDDDGVRETPQLLPPPYNYEPPAASLGAKPPPYYGGNRKDSVEEIITLDAMPLPLTNNITSRKRRRPGSRSESRLSNEAESLSIKAAEDDDEERHKARNIVRGDRPKRDPPVDRASRRDRTPDLLLQARTQPLEPSYRPPTDPNGDATTMAKQAAQLLRLDHMGKQAGKKHKRLVFVAE